MKRMPFVFALLLALPAWGGQGHATKPVAKAPSRHAQALKKPAPKPTAKSVTKVAPKPAPERAAKSFAKATLKPAAKPVAKSPARSASKHAPRAVAKSSAKLAKSCAKPIKPSAPRAVNEAPKPAPGDPDRDRVERLQEALDEIVHGKVLGRLRVGMRVESLATGQVLFDLRSNVLMDPASNQKLLATTTALLRLGNRFRYRTEISGPHPDGTGSIAGDIVLRGSEDPSLRSRHLDDLAESLATAGVTRVTGAVLADPRRIGSEEAASGGHSPLRVGGASIEIQVRPGARAGSRPSIAIRPPSDAFVVVNQAETRRRGKCKVSVEVSRAGSRFQVKVGGTVSMARGGVVVRRSPPNQPLFAAVLLRHALAEAGIVVEGPAGLYDYENGKRLAHAPPISGRLLAFAPSSSDTHPALAEPDSDWPTELLAVHESDPLPLLLRRVNKYSDNEWAERVLETVGAEVLGGVPTTTKGVRVLREALAELGLPASDFQPANGSGLGHHNRVTAAGMVDLFRHLYFDPRVGPELMQSLSVGGVDGTTRNRFRGTVAAHRVRAKTGTLNGVSCLSGFVGDGSEILAFSILVEGHRRRAVTSVRNAQVSAVNAMMHFVRRAPELTPSDEGTPGTDFETGEEVDENETALPEEGETSEPAHAGEGAQPAPTRPSP